jgi:hypothetical protein
MRESGLSRDENGSDIHRDNPIESAKIELVHQAAQKDSGIVY